MEEDQNGMSFDRFEHWLKYCLCHDVEKHFGKYIVFANQDNSRFSYVQIVEYVDIVVIYRTCLALDIESPPHFDNLEARIDKLLKAL